MPTKKAKSAAPSVKELMLAKLQLSRLDALDAKALMMGPADNKELIALDLPDKMAFEIPYFDAAGKPTGFKRWRYLEDTRDSFAQKTDAKPIKYIQARGTVSEFYLPPVVDWKEIQKTPETAIVITEGELKAACCTKHLMPCIGLGGVYSFKSAKRSLPLIRDFFDFEWKLRDVIVAFDSDAHTNPMVVKARNELCNELLALGAVPRVANITPSDTGAKRGIDDVIFESGPEALTEIFNDAESFAAAAAMHQLNAEAAYVRDPGMVVILESGLKMRSFDFTGHAYANRIYWESQLAANGASKLVKKEAAKEWISWPLRLELARITYSPGQDRITSKSEYNTWPGWGCQPARGDVTPWKQLLNHLFEGRPDERQWFEEWCALPLQRPGAKLYTASVIWGINTGTGKSLVGYSLGQIYGKNFGEIGDAELRDTRNQWAQEKQFIMGDDVTGHEQRKSADRLKSMITQQRMRIDPKYVPAYTIPDLINYLFTSNHPDAFFIEDDDRRFFVHEVTNLPLSKEFYRNYASWLKGPGAAALFYHLLNLKMNGREPEDRAPDTASRRAMVEDGLSDLGRWVRKLRDDPDLVLKFGDAKLSGDLWSTMDLIRLYDPDGKGRVTSGGLGREMKRAGFKQIYRGMPVKTKQGQSRLFAVRNAEEWEKCVSSSTIIKHYDESRGPIERPKKF